ncbi:hypothetical protein SAMN05444682_1141, partial [Parapedobacter indicus]
NFSNILNFSIVHNLFVNLTAINYNFLKPHNGLSIEFYTSHFFT